MNKIIILLTKEKIQSVYFDNGEYVPLSIDGNKIISYSDEKDFKRVVEAVTGTFNLEAIEDADFSFIIVVCGAEPQMANSLNKLLSSTAENNLLYVEHILPYILISKGLLNKNTVYTVKIIDTYYQLKLVGQNFEFVPVEKAYSDEIILEARDFSALFSFNASYLGEEDNMKKQLVELKRQKEEATAQCSRYVQHIADLKGQADKNIEYEVEIGAFKNQIADLKKQIKDLQAQNELLKKDKGHNSYNSNTRINNSPQEELYSDFFYYVKKDDINNAELCINAGINPNVREHDYGGRTALMIAAKEDYIMMAEMLIRRGADVTLRDTDGFLAFNYAKSNLMEEICKI